MEKPNSESGDGLEVIKSIIESEKAVNESGTAERDASVPQRLYGIAMEAAANAIVLADKDGNVVWCNTAFKSLTGYEANEIIGRNPRLLKSGVQDEAFYRELWQTILDGIVWRGRLVNKRKNGALYTEEMSITPVRDEAGELTHFIAVKEDISARLNAEQELAQSERRFRAMIERSNEGIALLDSEGILLYQSAACRRILGYEPYRISGRSVFDFMHPDDVGAMIAAFHGVREIEGASFSGEFRLLHRNGGWVWIEAAITNLIDDPAVGALVANYRDVTLRRHALDALRKSEEKYRVVVETAGESIFVIDRDGEILFANSTAAARLGRSTDDCVGLSARDLLSGNYSRSIMDAVRLAVDELKGSAFEAETSSFGKIAWHRCSTEPVHEADGRVRSALVIARDITEAKRTEEELISARDRAEKSDRLKDAFIANISHEIRTPLNIITGYAQVLEESLAGRLIENEGAMFDSIRRGSARLMRTVDLILTYSRLQTDDLTLRRSEVSMRRLLENLLADIRPIVEQNNLELLFTVDGGDPVLSVDQYIITQAFNNILDNAVKYTRKGSIAVSLSESPGGDVVVEIRDTGVGISPDYIPHIFDPYSQEEIGYGRSFDGIGLGLSLVKRYLEMHGAGIEVRSARGVGTVFTVTFRIGESVSADSGRRARPASDEAAAAGKPLLLVVEDDDDTVDMLELQLSGLYMLRTARNLKQATRALMEGGIRGILLDIALGAGETGLELLQIVRGSGLWKDLPVIAVTACAFEEDRRACLAAGCDDYLAKPVNKRSLVEMLKKHVR